MIDLLVINKETGEVEFSDEALALEVVKTLRSLNYNKQEGDADGRKRERIKREKRYVWFMYHPLTPYREYSEKEKLIEAKLEAKLPDDWVPSSELVAFIAEYIKHTKTRILRLLDSAEKAVDKVRIYLETVDLSERTAAGGIVNHPTDVIKLISDLPKAAQSLQELQLQAKSHLLAPAKKSRGDAEIGWIMEEKQEERL